MSVNPQTQSPFVSRLPREIRDAIYLELWRSSGLRQHIIWHGERPDTHFCRWSCSTDFQLVDRVQDEIENLRQELGVPLGDIIERWYDPRSAPLCRAMQSPWVNHWPCGEDAYNKRGLSAINGFQLAGGLCWVKQDASSPHEGDALSTARGVYMPMLLSCKMISAECLQSIYESTTFIFIDTATIQLFFGACYLPEGMKPGICNPTFTPPAFFKHVRSLEISLSPDLPMSLWCTRPPAMSSHEAYDFHWLRLEKFQNLQRLRIWIASRSIACGPDANNNFRGIMQFDAQALDQLAACFDRISSVTLSSPLSSKIEPDEGFLESITSTGTRIYKRGTGDRFHPFLIKIIPDDTFDGYIETTSSREVRLGESNGSHVVMPED